MRDWQWRKCNHDMARHVLAGITALSTNAFYDACTAMTDFNLFSYQKTTFRTRTSSRTLAGHPFLQCTWHPDYRQLDSWAETDKQGNLPFSELMCTESAELEGEASGFLADLHSNPHPWSWSWGSRFRVEFAHTSKKKKVCWDGSGVWMGYLQGGLDLRYSRHPNWHEKLRQTQTTLGRLHISSGLGMSRDPSGGAGKHCRAAGWPD